MTSNRDKIYLEYQAILKELHGISPSLSSYKQLEQRARDCLVRLGGQVPRTPLFKTAKLDGVIVRNEYKPQRTRPQCTFGGCTKQVRTSGRDKYGNQEYLNYCGEHRTITRREKAENS